MTKNHTRVQAKDVRTKIQQLSYCDIFSLGIKQKGAGYYLELILREEAPYGVPKLLDGIPIVLFVMKGK